MPNDIDLTRKELRSLRERIKASNIPHRKKNNLRIATWNIRNFGSRKSDRAVSYISEVCKNFDIIAIQEVKDSLEGLEKLQKRLGPHYRIMFSDPSGNTERLVFVYDRNRVVYTGLAAEIVMRPGRGKEEEEIERMKKKMNGMSEQKKERYRRQLEKKKEQKKIIEFERTPYMVSFRASDCNFVLVTVHIYYGSGKFVEFREQEIKNLARFIQKRAEDQEAIDPDFIVLGDFNIKDIGGKFFKALRSGGLRVPKEIQRLGTNLSKKKHFDQIAYHRYRDSTLIYTGRANVIDFVGAVYTDVPEKLKYRLTDHLPLWAEFTVSPDRNPRRINP